MRYFRVIVLFIFGLSFSNLYGQVSVADTSDRLDSITIAKIDSIDVVFSSCISIDCRTPEQWFNYLELKKNLNAQQLFELTDNNNATVRTYAFWALIEIGSPLVLNCLKNHRSDLDSIKYFSGCTHQTLNLIDFWIVKAANVERTNFTKSEKKELEKLIKEIVSDRKSKSEYIKSHF